MAPHVFCSLLTVRNCPRSRLRVSHPQPWIFSVERTLAPQRLLRESFLFLVTGLAPPPLVRSGRRLRRRPFSFLPLSPGRWFVPWDLFRPFPRLFPSLPRVLGPSLFWVVWPGCRLATDTACTRVGLSVGLVGFFGLRSPTFPTPLWSLSLVPHGVPPVLLPTPLGAVWL